MSGAVVTPELVQRNLQRLTAESSLSMRSISVLSGISYARLVRQLAGTECKFTVVDVASITRALGYKLEIVFENEPDMRPCTIDECVEDEHEWDNGEQFHPCRLQAVEGDGFIVHAHLLDEGWTAWADADDLADAHDGVEQARALAEAFERMQARCDGLNGVKLERHTEPGSPAFEAAL